MRIHIYTHVVLGKLFVMFIVKKIVAKHHLHLHHHQREKKLNACKYFNIIINYTYEKFLVAFLYTSYSLSLAVYIVHMHICYHKNNHTKTAIHNTSK